MLAERLERADFDRVRDSAKRAGGWYSRAFGRQAGGFGFETEAEALAWTGREFPAPEAPGDSPSGRYAPTDADRAPFGPAERAELDTLQAAHERGERVDFLRIGHLQTLKVRAEPEPADSPGGLDPGTIEAVVGTCAQVPTIPCRSTWTAGGSGACPNPAELEHDGVPCCAECYHDAEPQDGDSPRGT